jgi:hypothetical protein
MSSNYGRPSMVATCTSKGVEQQEIAVRVLRRGHRVTSGKATVVFGSTAESQAKVSDGAPEWKFTPFTGSTPLTQPGSDDCFTATRVTSADEVIAAMEPTWGNVYKNVLIDWHALAPCMDNWLNLDDEEQLRSMAGIVKVLPSRDAFDRYRYMPVTRGMSAGQRTLLHNWCDNPAPPAENAMEITAGLNATVEFANDNVDLSRGLGS